MPLELGRGNIASENGDYSDILITHKNTEEFYRQQGLKRVLTTKYLWALGVGTVMANSFFGWNYGEAVVNRMSFLLALIIITVFYFTFMLTFAEMATTFPYAGGPYAFARRAFGKTFGYLTGVTTVLQYVFAAAVVAYSLGQYIHFLVPKMPALVISVLALLVLTVIQIIGIREASLIQFIITGCAVSGFILFYMGTYHAANINFSLPQVNNADVTGIFMSIPFALWFYIGSEGIAMTAEETKEPDKSIPVGFLTTTLTMIFVAAGAWFFSTYASMSQEYPILGSYPLFSVLSNVQQNDKILLTVFAILGMSAFLASLQAIINASSRQVFALSRAGYLPHFLSKIHYRRRTPYLATVLPGLLAIICMLMIKAKFLITMAGLAANIMYLIILVAFFKIRLDQPDLPQTYTVPLYPFTPTIALVISLVGLISFTLFYYQAIIAMVFIYSMGVVLFLCLIRNNILDDAPEEFSAESALFQQKVTIDKVKGNHR